MTYLFTFLFSGEALCVSSMCTLEEVEQMNWDISRALYTSQYVCSFVHAIPVSPCIQLLQTGSDYLLLLEEIEVSRGHIQVTLLVIVMGEIQMWVPLLV